MKPGAALSVLTLRVDLLPPDPDFVVAPPPTPVLTILVDGVDPFAADEHGWRGFAPDALLQSDSPLLPVAGERRVAVCVCCCGDGGCGAIAPIVSGSVRDDTVSWTDARVYTGVFMHGPVAGDVSDGRGRPYPLPDLHYDARQYTAEVERAVLAYRAG